MNETNIILVVDDQAGVRKLLKEVLHGDQREIHLLSNGEEALDFLRKVTPDLVLLDMKMPGISGLEVIRGLKKIKYQGKVILMTAYGELEIIAKAKAMGITAYINKPFDVNEIRELVTKILTGNTDT